MGSGFNQGDILPLEGTATGHVVRTQRSLICEDIAERPRFRAWDQLARAGLRSSILVPLISKAKIVATFSLLSSRPGAYGKREKTILECLAPYIAFAIEHSRLREEAKERASETESIGEVARIVTSSLNIDQVYERFTAEVGKLVDFDQAAINLIDDVKGSVRIAHLSRRTGSVFNQGDTFPLEGSATAYVAKTERVLVDADLGEHSRFWTWDQLVKDGIKSAIIIPLVSKERVIGAFCLTSRRLNTYGTREQNILERLASQIGPAVENCQVFQEMKRLALVLESIGDAVHFLDTQGNIQYMNKAAQQMFGYGLDQVLGSPATVLSPPDPGRQALFSEVISEGLERGWTGEVRGVKSGGAELDMNLTATPVIDGEGAVIGLVSVVRDVTTRKWMEEALADIEERYRDVTETATYALVMIDEDSKIMFANRAAESVFGYTIEEMLGQQLAMLVPEYPAGGGPASLEQHLQHAERSGTWMSVELIGLHKSGKGIPLEISFGEFIKNGRRILAGILHDITERKRADEALREKELKTKEVLALQRVDQLRKDLVATVSHEIRNPLASIKGYISTLLQRDVKWEPEMQREFLEVADQEADRLSRLVGDLLTMSQLEAGVLQLERERISLDDISSDLDAHLTPLVSQHIMEMVLPDDIPPVFVDKHRIIQVISNLVSNAAKFSEPGTRITIGATKGNSEVVVRVSNEGRGIPSDRLERVFDAFYRVEGSLVASGSGIGLGLSICHRLIEAHGGKTWVESESGKGSTFYFSLPAVGTVENQDA